MPQTAYRCDKIALAGSSSLASPENWVGMPLFFALAWLRAEKENSEE